MTDRGWGSFTNPRYDTCSSGPGTCSSGTGTCSCGTGTCGSGAGISKELSRKTVSGKLGERTTDEELQGMINEAVGDQPGKFS